MRLIAVTASSPKESRVCRMCSSLNNRTLEDVRDNPNVRLQRDEIKTKQTKPITKKLAFWESSGRQRPPLTCCVMNKCITVCIFCITVYSIM